MIHKNIILKTTENKGNGLFAVQTIHKNEVVWNNVGLNKSKHFTKNSLKKLDPKYGRLSYWDGKYFTIDDDDPGSFMNHSCNPNTWWVGEELVALRNIFPGEEVTYDYATTDIEGINGQPKLKCFCNDKDCRKTIYPDDLLRYPELRKKHKDHLPDYVEDWLTKNLT